MEQKKGGIAHQIYLTFFIILLLWGSMPAESHMEMKLTVTITLIIFLILSILLNLRK